MHLRQTVVPRWLHGLPRYVLLAVIVGFLGAEMFAFRRLRAPLPLSRRPPARSSSGPGLSSVKKKVAPCHGNPFQILRNFSYYRHASGEGSRDAQNIDSAVASRLCALCSISSLAAQNTKPIKTKLWRGTGCPSSAGRPLLQSLLAQLHAKLIEGNR